MGFNSQLSREAIIGFNNTTTAVTINSLIMAYQASSGQGQIRILGGSTLTTNADLMVGRGDNQTAKLFVDNGKLITKGNAYLGSAVGGGTVTVSGGSSWTVDGTLNLAAEGLLSAAKKTASLGTVTVTGAGSTMNIGAGAAPNTITLNVGQYGRGTFNIEDQAIVTHTGNVTVGNQPGSNGILKIAGGGQLTTSGIAWISGQPQAATGTGTVTVTGTAASGPASHWTVGGLLYVGNSGKGTLNIDTGGVVTAKSGTWVSQDPVFPSNGTLNISSNGILETTYLKKGSGVAQVNINGGILKALADDTSTQRFITDFTGTEFAIGASGMTIDSNGFAVTAVSPLTSSVNGALTVNDSSAAQTGNLTLSGANTFVGLTVNGGTVTAGSATAFGQSSGVLTVNGGTAALNNNSMTFAGLKGTGGTINLGSGTLTLNQASDTTFAGGIIGSGGLTKNDAGHLTLTGVSTFTGALTANAGTMTFDGGASLTHTANNTFNVALGNSATAIVNVKDGSTYSTRGKLRVAVGTDSDGTVNVEDAGSAMTFNDGFAIIVGQGSNAKGTLNISNNATVTAGGYSIFGMAAGSTGNLNITGGSSLTTTGNGFLGGETSTTQTGTGNATISDAGSQWNVNGNLYVGQYGTGNLTIGTSTNSGGTVTVNGATIVANAGASSGTVKVSNGGTLATSSLRTGGGTGAKSVTFDNGTLRATGASTDFISGFTGAQFEIASGGMTVDSAGHAVTATAVLSGDGTLTKVGGGTLTLSGANTFSGGLTVNGGTVAAGAADAFSSGLLTVAGGATADLAGFDQTVSGLASSGTTGTASVKLGAGTLTVDQTTGTSSSFAGVISGTGGLTKASAGTLTLSGANSYTGATTVSGGTLVVDGDQSAATGTTSVASGATLAGAGTLGGAVSVASGGRLLSQNDATLGPSALDIKGNLTLASGANLDYAFGTTPNADPDGLLIDVAGDVDLGGATLNVSGSGFDPGGVYGLIEYTGTKSGSLVAGTIPAGLYVQTAMAGRINLVNTNGLGAFSFWDGDNNAGNGTIDGGNGVWQGDAFSANQNWLEATGTTNGTFRGGPAIFGGTAGTVKVDNSLGAIVVSGMQFMADGYVLDGLTANDTITLTPATGTQVEIAVGDKNSIPYTATINAGLTGAAELVKSDAGTLVLTNTGNDYSGGTRIEDGTLSISSDGNLGRSAGGQLDTALTLAGSTNQVATLQNTQAISTTRQVTLEGTGGTFQTDADLTLGGDVGGAGGLVKTGAGTLTLSGANSYGGTTVQAGTLKAGSDTAFGAATGTLTVNAGTADLNGHSMTLAGLKGTGGEVKLGDATVGASTLTLNQTAATASYAGIISGTGALVKNGAGALTLSGANSFAGGLTVGGGSVVAGSATAFGTGVLTVNAGTADLNGKSMTLAGLKGTGGEVKLGDATVGASTLTLNQTAATASYAGIISGTGALVKNGAGALTLSGANSFAGGLTVGGGSVVAGSATAFGPGMLTVNAGTADLNGKSMTLAGLKGTGGEVKLGDNVVGASVLTLDQTADTDYAGIISGSGSLKKAGTGKLTLSGANSFSGGVTLNNGDLVAGSGSAFGSGMLTVNAGTADLAGHSMTLAGLQGNGGAVKLGDATVGASVLTLDQTATTTAHAIISGTGSLVMNGSGTLTLAGANTFTGGVRIEAGTVKAGSASAFGAGVLTVNAGTADLNGNAVTLSGLAGTGGTVALGAQTLTLDPGTGATYSGRITGTGGKLVKDGSGTQILAGTNTYSGGTTVKAGTLQAAAGATQAFGATTAMLTVDGGIADLNGNDMTFAGLQNTAGTAGGEVKLGTGTLTLDQSVDTSFAGRITGTTGGLTKTNTGTLTLSGASSYGGPTNVNGGTLQLNGSLTSPTTVDGTTSVLAGRGSITGDVTVQNGGTLRSYDDNADGQNRLAITGKLTVDAASFLQYDYGRNPNLDPDVLMVDVTGDVDLNGTVNVTNSSGVDFGPGVYGIIQYSGNRTGTLKAGSTLAPFNLTLQQGVVQGEINLVNLGTGERNWWNPGGTPGSITGGNGNWTMAQAGSDAANWVDQDGNNNGHYEQSFFAVFAGNPGTVTVTDGGVTTPGMQFLVDGYTIQGDPITLANPAGVGNTAPGRTSIVVGNRSGHSNSHFVTIASVLKGTDMLVKEDVGTLKLSGINTYSGGTLIDDGTLQIAADHNLGADASGGLTTAITFDGTSNVAATLRNTGAINTIRPVTLDGAGGTFETVANLTLGGTVGGAGALTKTGAATLTLSGNNSYAGGTFLNAGIVSVKANANLGADAGGLTFNGGTLENTDAFTTSARPVTVNAAGGTFKTDADLTLAGAISGPTGATGNLTKSGAGKLILTADNSTYTGTLTVASGELHVGNGGASGTLGAETGSIALAGSATSLVFDRADAYAYDGLITGNGALTQKGSGTTTLTGANSYKGATTVQSGTLVVNGDQTTATGATTVMNGATLRGGGTVGGDVTVQSGGNLTAQDEAGSGISALAIKGNLALNPGANLNYDYGISPNGNHDALMIQVGGNLDLNGILNVANTSGQDFEAGVYGLIRYGGSLSGSGLTLGTMPGSDFLVQTSVAGRVNLAYTGGETLNFWDGSQMTADGRVNGGSGVWQAAAGNTNWTTHDGTVNAGYADDSMPVFMGTPGTVTVDDSRGAIRVSGMQFAVSGYTVQGDAITLTAGRTGIRVGELSHDSHTYVATIASELTGQGQLAKTDLGTLILTGTNSYTGGTLIDAGTLQVSKDENLGAAGTALELDGGTLKNTAAFTSARNVSLDANGGTFETDKDLTLSGPVTGRGSLTKSGAGALMLSGRSTYTGATFVKAGTLAAGRAGAFSPASAFNVDAGATLALNGYDQSVGALANAGRVSLQGTTPGATLTVNGNYTGKDGGTVALSTRLEGDDSKTDRLVVKGATSGNTTLAVTNVGGGGAQTDKGIRLVEVDGASNGTFTLAGDYVFEGDQALVAGAYAYRLFKNGIDANDGDWYLRSSLLEQDIPQFQAGVPVYEAYAGILQSFNQLDSLQSRLGNRAWTIEAQGADGLSEEVAPEQGAGGQSLGVWGNIEASRHRYRPEHSTSDTDYDAAVWKLEAGVDSQLFETEKGRLIGGASLHYGTIAADIFSPHGEGKIDATGYGIAGTLTWYGNDGLYLDGQAKLTWYDSDLSSTTANQSLASGNDGRGYALSIEAGKRIPLRPDWFFTPQAQLAWSRVDFDGFSDGFDADVTLSDGDSVLARMGLSVDHEREWQDSLGQTRRIHAYGLANLYYDFDNGTTIDVASTPFTTKNEPLWAGIGLGGSYNWNNDKFSLYGQAIAKTSINNFADSNIISGNIGLRVRW
ncbi:autotransporter-associated beta strand repeat-containing protein [Phyllobacterium phragmitis]|uniref:Autotransporter-associated beta strand repeat-containing protein n=1 Tax=Phyllobacterium phragmitis TaxID=2670329 RepID=A0ABQ0H1P6_9HYPH